MKIALAGNPNSGKTTMYNALTGQNEKVGNWTGVTVEKKEHSLKKVYRNDKSVTVIDLPGAYSISPYTNEESITGDYIKTENPDAIINIVDATNLSRSLFFTTQLLELGIPVVVALNKKDINNKKGTTIDVTALADKLGCPVVETVSTSGAGLDILIDTAINTSYTIQSAFANNDRKRFDVVKSIVKSVEKRRVFSHNINFSDKLDRILTNKWFGIPIFAIVMFLVFQISQSESPIGLGKYFEGILTGWIDAFQGYVANIFADANPFLSALLVDGIIGGVSAVIGFLPLVMVMYFLIALLEDCGYMSRVAVILDPIFKKVGLSGKSVIPFVITIGCAVPGIMASRTIKNERERRTTAMLAPFMPCGAKIPVIALFAGVFFDDAGWVSTLVYLSGIALIFFGALLVNKITGNNSKKSFFIIELPEYKLPSLWGAFKTMCGRGKAYIVKAATIILLCNTAVQIMQTFSWNFSVAQATDASILATVATPFAYLLVPIVGVLSWQLAAAAITGFIAKENVVGTLAVCFVGLENLIDTEELALISGAGGDVAGIMAITKAAALAYLMFNLYTPPCFAAIGAMNAEMKSRKWVWSGIGLQLGIGYTVGYLVYTVGTLITAPHTLNIPAAIGGFIAVLAFALIITKLILKNKGEKI